MTNDHVALQLMACTLQDYIYDELRKIYEDHQLHVTPIISDAKEWLAQEVAKGDMPRRHYRSYSMRLNPARWADVMRNVTPTRLDALLAYCKSQEKEVPPFMQYLLRSFCCFTHDEPFEEDLKRVAWPILMAKQPEIQTIIEGMARQADYVPFMQAMPGNMLTTIFYHVYVSQWIALQPATDMELVRLLFFDNPLLDESRRHQHRDAYLYNVEFLQTGKLAELQAQMTPDGEYHHKLAALQKLHEGQPDEALALLAAVLKSTDKNIFDEPLTNFAYALALGQSKLPKARKMAEKLMRSREVTGTDYCYAMQLVLQHYVAGNAADFFVNNPLTNCHDTMCWRLATLFLHHFQILDKEPAAITEAGMLVVNSGYDYLRLIWSDDYDVLQPLAGQLQRQTGLSNTLLPKVERLEQWQRVMEQLLKLHKPATPATKTETPITLEMERVAYMVNLRNRNVQPKLQKSKDGGLTWSKGRNIALKSFEDNRSSYMTAQDRQVSRMVKTYSYGWYGQVSYELAGIGVIAALAGCQCVFDEFTDQRIDIVEEPLQLTVTPTPNGYAVRSNASLDRLDASGICLTQEGNKQVTIVRVNSKQRKTLELLHDVDTFPLASKKPLTQLLQNLSGTFTVMSPLLKNATDLKHVEASALIAVQIAPAAETARVLAGSGRASIPLYSVSLAVKPFGTHPPYQQPGKGMEIVSTKIAGERVQTERNLEAELANLEKLHKLMAPLGLDETDDTHWLMDTAQCLTLLETVRTTQDLAYVEWPQGARMRVVRPAIDASKLQLKISTVGQWFELEGDVQIGEKEKMKMAKLLQRLREAEGNFIRIEGDEYVALSEQLTRQLQAIDKMLAGRGKELKVATMNGLQLAALEELGAKVKADETFRQLMQRIEEAGAMNFTLPANIHAELRPYQQEGFVWMSRLAHWGAGACLADDMGLGKTLQAITLMQSRAAKGPQLVVMPTSVLLNWQQELRRFAPALTVKVLNMGDRRQLVERAGAGDVVLSTYGLLVTETELTASRNWATIVLDEAHTIKNRDTQTSKGAMQLKGDFRLLLTGTPLQNHLSEIWNLFQFANPGLLGSYQQFTDRFITPIERNHDNERQRLLRRMLSPFLLRRTKEDVLSELPEKTEITLRVELSADEQALYDNLRQQAIANLEEEGKSTLQALAEITRLRQAACHPRLVNPKLALPSSKTQAFLELVEQLRSGGHRALVFSQFTSHLALIREALDNQQVAYLYLDGSTTPQERERLVRQFQTGGEPLFLISLKAGGLGLNLTAADYVIHLDPWWNPAIEDQASDRAHRIGQERPVTVYRLIAAGTIEEKIIRLHQNKRSMADALLQDSDMFTQLSTDDIIRLLREGAEAIS
jgi:superfamily II DNA or RNA helicase